MEKTTIRFSDLPVEIQEKVRAFYVEDDAHTEFFSEDVNNYLSEKLPHSDLKVEYSLSYCQGDGFNIYGEVSLADMCDVVDWEGFKFTEKEKRFILWAVKSENYGYSTHIPSCWRGGICCRAKEASFGGEVEDELEYCGMRGINRKALDKFHDACVNYFEELCAEFESDGYEYFYEPSDDELQYLYNEYRELFTEESA